MFAVWLSVTFVNKQGQYFNYWVAIISCDSNQGVGCKYERLYAVKINTIQFRDLIRKFWGLFANIQARNGPKWGVNFEFRCR